MNSLEIHDSIDNDESSENKNNRNTPAFPQGDCVVQEGMSLREYAAITLKVPESGTDWLDDMIRESFRDDFAGKALKALLPTGVEKSGFTKSRAQCPEDAYKVADEMLAARENGNIDEWMEDFRERHELILCPEEVQKFIEFHRLEKDVFLSRKSDCITIMNPRDMNINSFLDDLREWCSPMTKIYIMDGVVNAKTRELTK